MKKELAYGHMYIMHPSDSRPSGQMPLEKRVPFDSLGVVVLARSSRWRCEYALIFFIIIIIESGKAK